MLRTISILLAVVCLVGCTQQKTTNTMLPDQNKHTSMALLDRAKAGSPKAQYLIAYRYYYGIGVQENVGLAIAWMEIAKQNGYLLAEKALDSMESENPDTAAAGDEPTYIPRPENLPAAPTNRSKFAKYLQDTDMGSVGDTHQFTLGLHNSESEAAAQAFINEHNLDRSKTSVRVKKHGGKTEYEVVYGNYSSIGEARDGIRALPKNLRQLRPSVLPNDSASTSFNMPQQRQQQSSLFPEHWLKDSNKTG